jgi:hypothetical protein
MTISAYKPYEYTIQHADFSTMSIAHEQRIAELEQRVMDLTSQIGYMSRIEFCKHYAELVLRVEKLEQRSKPGPKPKEQP